MTATPPALPVAVRAAPAVRRGIVLGGGGVLGFAWMVGALAALADAEQRDPRDADVLLGTSAGSVLAALLAAGVGVDAIVRHQQGILVEGDPRLQFDSHSDSSAALRRWPSPRVGSPALLRRVARHPRRYPPLAALSSLAPPGRATLRPLGRMIEQLAPAGQWARHPRIWVVAMDYATGRRVAFGRSDAPPAGLAEAVMASCAIPGWYAPVVIGGRRYVDGGTCSPTSVDLLVGHGLDEVVVLAPMVSFEYDAPTTVAARLERRLRRAWLRRLRHEVGKVRRGGTRVSILGPGREDLEAIGSNLMDRSRRERVLETSLRTSAAALRTPPAQRRAG
jgi:NTE family protein